MKIFRNKILFKFITSLCMVFAIFSFLNITRVYADSNEDEVFGGALLTPITKLLTGLGDGIMDIIHSSILEQDETIIRLDGTADSWWNAHGSSVLGWLVGALVFASIIALTLAGGAGVAIVGSGLTFAQNLLGGCFIIKTVTTAFLYGIASGYGATAVARVVDSTLMPDDIYLPVFNLTPEEIFSNEVWLFDVNFFEPNNYKLQADADVITVHSVNGAVDGYQDLYDQANELYGNGSNIPISIETARNNNAISKLLDDVNIALASNGKEEIKNSKHQLKVHTVDLDEFNPGASYAANSQAYRKENVGIFIVNQKDGSNYLSIVFKTQAYEAWTSTTQPYQPPAAGNGTENELTTTSTIITVQQTEKVDYEKESIATELKGVISKWYYNLTNLAILMLLIVLIYSGIRIVIGSTAGEKAKYKERIIDWLVAMCLVFIMHYIMVFAVTLNERFIDLIDSVHDEKGIIKYIHLEKENHINVATKDDRLSQYIKTGNELDPTLTSDMKFLQWSTNIMGGIRIEQQLIHEGTANWIGYSLCYLVLVAYTVIFAWTYIRRVLYMAFLTMIAPLVAMTYPIDKITDGKAQAFNSWLREYIFNLLIQPFHLLLYTVLVTSAWELAGENALYALVAVGFMTPAEKLLRKFFGFEKAQTPGLLSGAAGAALAMSGLQSLMRFGNSGKNPEDDEEEKSDIKFSSSDSVSAKDTVLDTVSGSSNRRVNDENVDVGNEDTENESDDITRLRLNGQTRTGDPDDVNNTEIIDNTTEGRDSDNRRVRTADINLDGQENGEEESEEEKENVILPSVGNTGEGRTIPATTDDFEKKQKGRFRRTLGAVGAGIGGVSRAYGQKTYKRMQKAKPIRSLARAVGGLSGGLLFGMAGLALGIASGDVSKAFQYTTAGATGGYGLGKGLAGMGANALSVNGSDIKDEMDLAYYGKDYKDAKLRQEQKELVHNEDAIKFIRRTCGVSRRDAQNILATTGARCYESDIKNIEDIAAIYQYEQEEIKKGYVNIVNGKWENAIEEMLDNDDSWKNAQLSTEEIEAARRATDVEIATLTEKKVSEDVKALAETEVNGDVIAFTQQRASELNREIDKIKQTGEAKEIIEEKIKLATEQAQAEIKKRREELIKQKKEEIRKREEYMRELKAEKEKEVRGENESRIIKQYKEGIAREKERRRLIEEHKDAINKDIEKARKEMLAGNSKRYHEFKENGFISGVVMQKYAKRVPDNYNQLGQDKVDKIDERFYKEFYDDAKNNRGMSHEQAEAAAKEATQIVHSGIRQYMDKKESLFTAK